MGDAIRSLTLLLEVDASDQVAVGSQAMGGDVRVPLSVLATFLLTLITVPAQLVPQYSAPQASGFSVTVVPATSGGSVWLVLTPGGAYAAGTVLMPASPVDQQEVLVTSEQAITALTVNGNGAGIVGAPTTLGAHGFFRMRYDGVSLKWRRAG